jgi:predicted metalloprotease with PDZ domain
VDWPVFLTLAPAAPASTGTAQAEADDYYALADSQVLLGPELEVRRLEGTPPLFVASYAESELDAERVGRTGREALDAVVAYFGSAPFDHYTIAVEVLRPVSPDHEYGFSMEHLDSGTFFLDERGALTAHSTDAKLRRTRYNYAHHIAHAWIPKRSYGHGYFPFSWDEAPILDTIWLSEGFAQYAAAAALAAQMGDAGSAWLETLVASRFQETLAETPDFIRAMDTVALSRLASTQYSEDFRTGSNSFSRGGMMAYEMDQRIRSRTAHRRSLADALRHLVAWSARERRPFQLDRIPELLSEGAGVELSDVYEKWMLAPAPGS